MTGIEYYFNILNAPKSIDNNTKVKSIVHLEFYTLYNIDFKSFL